MLKANYHACLIPFHATCIDFCFQVALIVGDMRFAAHKIVLCRSSDVFDRMLSRRWAKPVRERRHAAQMTRSTLLGLSRAFAERRCRLPARFRRVFAFSLLQSGFAQRDQRAAAPHIG